MRVLDPGSLENSLRALFARRGPAAPPEMDEGTLAVKSPSGTVVGNVYTLALGGGQYTEHWVVYDSNFLSGGDCTFSWVNSTAPNWTTILADIKNTYNGQNGQKDWHDFSYAGITVTRATPPTQAQINAMPDMPAGHEKRVFELKNGSSVTGGWYQDIYPSGSLNRTEHWRCGSSYNEPANGGPVSVVRQVGSTLTVKQFLTNWVNAGGYYVSISYTWGGLP